MVTQRIKIVVFGKRHTGQGPLGRAWGRTQADLPALQPVVIYERDVVEHNLIVEAWVLSLDEKFDYMRPSMYTKADGFVYTYEATELPANISVALEYIDPYIREIRESLGKNSIPPQILVGTVIDPTLSLENRDETFIEEWIVKWNINCKLEMNMTDKKQFHENVENIFKVMLELIDYGKK